MVHIATILVVFGVIFFAELPDKSMFATLALSIRYPKSYVWIGAALAFTVHVSIAVTAGRLMTLLPKNILEYVVGTLFLIGAALLAFGKDEDASKERQTLAHSPVANDKKPFKVIMTAFTVVFLGEWGDITQIMTANYAARYHDPVSVGIGATAALWTVAGIGVFLGSKLLSHISARTLQRAIAVVLTVFAVLSFATALGVNFSHL
jgi:putative Ca2+/H+ antiporter (TMEM165/GDT1 family)